MVRTEVPATAAAQAMTRLKPPTTSPLQQPLETAQHTNVYHRKELVVPLCSACVQLRRSYLGAGYSSSSSDDEFEDTDYIVPRGRLLEDYQRLALHTERHLKGEWGCCGYWRLGVGGFNSPDGQLR